MIKRERKVESLEVYKLLVGLAAPVRAILDELGTAGCMQSMPTVRVRSEAPPLEMNS